MGWDICAWARIGLEKIHPATGHDRTERCFAMQLALAVGEQKGWMPFDKTGHNPGLHSGLEEPRRRVWARRTAWKRLLKEGRVVMSPVLKLWGNLEPFGSLRQSWTLSRGLTALVAIPGRKDWEGRNP
jgi:hypothetical protein